MRLCDRPGCGKPHVGRRAWWIDHDRYLTLGDDDPEQGTVIEAARVETFNV